MNTVVRDSEANLCANAAGLVIRPVPITHHGIHFRVVDHIRIAVMVSCRGRLRIDRIRQADRRFPVNAIVGCYNGRILINRSSCDIGRVNCPVTVTIPCRVPYNNIWVCDLVWKMVAVFIIRGKILITVAFTSGGSVTSAAKSSTGECRRNQCEG